MNDMRTLHAASAAPVIRAGLDLARIRAEFPILRQRVHGKPLVYLDNAASVQKPKAVIDAIRQHPSRRPLAVRALYVRLRRRAGESAGFPERRQRPRDHFHSQHHGEH